MPLIVLARIIATVLSLCVVALAFYLLATWYEGEVYPVQGGSTVRFRDDWRLWAGLGLAAWSVLGRFVVVKALARRDTNPSLAKRAEGRAHTTPDGMHLYVETVGDGRRTSIILTHGWGLDSTIWHYAKQDLRELNLTCWDLRGLGRSKVKALASIALANFAQDLKDLVESAGRPVVLVGHSIGGMTIQTLARDHPEMFGREVAGVVLINTTHTNPLKTMWASRLATGLRRPLIEPLMKLTIWLEPLAWLAAWQSYLSGAAHAANRLGFGRTVTRSELEHTTFLATRNRPAVQAKGNLDMFGWDAGEGLAALRQVPVLVIGGDIDIVTKLEASQRIAEATGADLTVVSGANHMGFLEQREPYNAAIAKFVARFESAPA